MRAAEPLGLAAGFEGPTPKFSCLCVVTNQPAFSVAKINGTENGMGVFRTLCDLDLHVADRPGWGGQLVAVYQVAKVLNGSRTTKIVALPLPT
jgi:hypothetical protein